MTDLRHPDDHLPVESQYRRVRLGAFFYRAVGQLTAVLLYAVAMFWAWMIGYLMGLTA